MMGKYLLEISQLQTEVERLRGERDRYKEALEFYADAISYKYLSRGSFGYHRGIDLDCGNQAMTALQDNKGEGDEH
jgi:hypothetical protein